MSSGRPPSTTHEQVEQVALELFSESGFEQTTVEDIAAAVGVGRRTIFRYFPSKNDMVWGNFDRVLGRLRSSFEGESTETPLMDAVRRAVLHSNSYPPAQLPALRIRMNLINTVPALQAHALLSYDAWCGIVAEFAAARLGAEPTDLVPQTLARASLGTTMAAFKRWVENPAEDLSACIDRAFRELAGGFSVEAAPA